MMINSTSIFLTGSLLVDSGIITLESSDIQLSDNALLRAEGINSMNSQLCGMGELLLLTVVRVYASYHPHLICNFNPRCHLYTLVKHQPNRFGLLSFHEFHFRGRRVDDQWKSHYDRFVRERFSTSRSSYSYWS